MNRCALHRKEMAQLASDPSAPELPPTLRGHIDQCAECRKYWDQINAVCLLCASAAEDPDPSLPPSFHETWLSQTREHPSAPAPSFSTFASWPLKAAVAAFLLLLAAVPLLHRQKTAPPPLLSIDTSPPGTSPVTLLHYHLAAGNSELDSLMRQDSTGSATSERTYTLLTRSEDETY